MQKTNIITKIASGMVLSLIFLTQFVPTAYIYFKGAILALSIVCIFLALLQEKLKLLMWQVIGVLLLVLVALFFSIYGVMRDNPGAIRVMSVWVVWPIVYLLLSSLLVNNNSFIWLSKIFIFSLGCIVSYSFIYLGNSIGIIPDWLYITLDQGQIVEIYDGFVEYNLYSISSLLFLVPFVFHFYLEKYKRTCEISNESWILIAASLLLAILTGRRAVQLNLLLFPFIVICVNIFLRNNHRFHLSFKFYIAFAILLIIVFLVMQYLGLNYSALKKQFIDGFDFSSDGSSASERTIQFHALINEWLATSYLFGAGNGAAATISRSNEHPWAYELTYIYLLFSTGVMGTLFFFGWYAFGLIKLRESIMKRPDLVVFAAPMLTASISFCIAAASNPYIGKFDYIWIVLLPFFTAGWVKYQKKYNFV